jgi:hypothetical protein
MSEAKHTAGPWMTNGTAIETVVEPSYVIASVYEGDAVDIDSATADANARVIAAAPDLLAALKAFLDAGDGHDDFTDEWPAARAAVDKAEGRS